MLDDQFRDFSTFLPAIRFRTIFDVGAHVGRTARAIARLAPDAAIYAFEPVPVTFDALSSAVSDLPRAHCFRLALGDSNGSGAVKAKPLSPRNRIARHGEAVEIETGDNFCREHGIEGIDFLKIDTEGFDLRVCHGFSGMLHRQSVALIQVEAGMNPDNETHVPLHRFQEFMDAMGYCLFRIYEQKLSTQRPRLRRADAVFVSKARANGQAAELRDRAGRPAAEAEA